MDELRGVEVETTFNAQSLGAKYVPLLETRFCARKRFGRIQLGLGRDLWEGQGRLESYLTGRSTKAGATVDFLLTAKRGLQSRAVFCARR